MTSGSEEQEETLSPEDEERKNCDERERGTRERNKRKGTVALKRQEGRKQM